MRNRIITATVEEINLRGFKFTMSDLARRLSVSKSSLYEHFPSKDALISSILELILHDFHSQEENIYNSTLPLRQKLKAILTIKPDRFEPFSNRVYEDLRLSYPEEWQKVVQFRQERMSRIANLLQHGIDTGIIRPIHVSVAQQTIISALNGLTSYSFLTENNLTYQNAIAAMIDIIVEGLIVKK